MKYKTLAVSEAVHKQVKIIAAEKGMDIKTFVTLAIQYFINKYNEEES